jgi:hypothetical protein
MYSSGMSDLDFPPTERHRMPVNAPPRLLEPSYYLDNFAEVLTTILARYADLLSPEELRFITEFPKVPRDSQALLARMVMRRGDLFRASKLRYAEIGDTRTAAAPLIEAGWVTDRPMLGIDRLQGLLTKAELIRCLGLPRRYADWRKPGLVALLKAQFPKPRYFADWWRGENEVVYALLAARTCERFRLMFFGNHRQGWSEFVTADLKIFKYERTERTLHSRPFQSREHIVVFQRLAQCRELLEEGMPLEDLVTTVPQTIEDSDWLEERRQELLYLIAREFERSGNSDRALSIHANCRHRGARTRAIRLKLRARDWLGAHELCVRAQACPESEAELQYVRRVLPRAKRKLGVDDSVEPNSMQIPEFELVLEDLPAAGAVEYRVRDHLARDLAEPNTVRYVENGLINALFGLLCWPAIYAPVKGAFFHEFHRAPADLASPHFHRRRERHFDECLSHLESSRYRQAILRTFEEKWGVQSPFVRWRGLDRTVLRWALDCFPATHLRLWFEWIVRDVGENRAGFPDLVQFWPPERRYRMIEVKGPGDRLQANQRRLLEFCAAHGMPVAVCHVRWRT